MATAILAVFLFSAVGVAQTDSPPRRETVPLSEVLTRLFKIRKGMPQDKVFEVFDLKKTKGMSAMPTQTFPGVRVFYRTDCSNLLFCISLRQVTGTNDVSQVLEGVEMYSCNPKTDTSPMTIFAKPLTIKLIEEDAEPPAAPVAAERAVGAQ